jgi:hypothetical protein
MLGLPFESSSDAKKKKKQICLKILAVVLILPEHGLIMSYLDKLI